jgi:hypothetical protein
MRISLPDRQAQPPLDSRPVGSEKRRPPALPVPYRLPYGAAEPYAGAAKTRIPRWDELALQMGERKERLFVCLVIKQLDKSIVERDRGFDGKPDHRKNQTIVPAPF